MDYDPAKDAFDCFALWVRLQRHALLVAGDAWSHDGETVDLFALLAVRR